MRFQNSSLEGAWAGGSKCSMALSGIANSIIIKSVALPSILYIEIEM